jgi:predicted permease
MSKWLRYFEFFRRDPRRDIDDEISTHIEMRVSDLRARGFTEAAARERAVKEFGDADATRRETLRVDHRVMRRENRAEMFDAMLRDARVALRSMRASPGFAISAVLCAAAGIGITAAMVSASYAILVRALPYRDSEHLVSIYSEHPQRGYRGANISFPDFVSWRDESKAFTGIGIWTWSTKTLASDAATGAERLNGSDVSWDLFRILGVPPMLGRDFLREEEQAGRNFEVLISHSLWQRRFASDSSILGRTIGLDGRPWTVVGVMPPAFNFPATADYWVPFVPAPNELRENRSYAGAIGRFREDVTFDQARADLHRVDATLAARFPDLNGGWRADVITIRDDLVGSLREPLKVLMAAVGLVLLLACINIANLTLARGAARSRELAIRTAIGASRGRLVRQLMTESLVVAVGGGVIGVGIAAAGIRLLTTAFPNGVPSYLHIGLDGMALAAIAAITVLTGILFGVVPALRGSRVDLNGSLRDGTTGSGSGVDRARLRSGLVVAEVALSVVLMTGALLLLRTYRNLHDKPLGYTPQGVVSARITLPRNAGYPARADVKRFYDQLFERINADQRVAMSGAAQGTPMTGWDVQGAVDVEGMPAPKSNEAIVAHYQYVTPNYFQTIGVRLVRGQWLSAATADSMNPKVLINEMFVQKAFNGAEPIGKRVRIGKDGPYATIVGVVADFQEFRLPQAIVPAVFYSDAEISVRQKTVVLRAKAGDPLDLVPLVRTAVREIDPNVAVYQIQTLDDVLSGVLWRQRLMGNLLVVFAALAMGMACLGLYGVVSYAVSQRTREFGVRVALGATRGQLMRLVLGNGARLALAGIAAGLVAAWFAVRILGTLLYGVEAKDPATFGLVAVTLTAVALLATAIPSRRATRVDPLIAMRSE